MPSDLTSDKIQDEGGRRVLKFCVNGHNLAAIARICTKFDREIQNLVQEAVLPSKFTSDKIQDGGGRHIEIWGASQLVTRSTRHSPNFSDELTV